MRDAHLHWAVALAEEAGGRVISPEQDRVLQEIAASMDDLRAALTRALEVGDRESGLRILIGLDPFWMNFAVREAHYWLEELLAEPVSVSPVTLGRGLSTYGVVLAIHGEITQAVEVQERALTLLREAGDARGVAWATHYLAIGRWQSVDPEEVKRLSLEALAAFEELNEPVGIGRSLWWLVLWELEFGSPEEAQQYGSRLQDFGSRLPGPLVRAHVAEATGLLARVRGDLAEACAISTRRLACTLGSATLDACRTASSTWR